MIKLLKIVLIFVFTVIVFSEVNMVYFNQLNFSRSHILLIFIIVLLLMFKNKITWTILFAIGIYGTFDFFYTTHDDAPSFMDFTSNLHFLYGELGAVLGRIMKIYPLLFYLGTSIVLLIDCIKKYNLKR